MKSCNSKRIGLISNRLAIGSLSSLLLVGMAGSALAQRGGGRQLQQDQTGQDPTGLNQNGQLDQQGGQRQRGGRGGGGQQGGFNGGGQGGFSGGQRQYTQYNPNAGGDPFSQEFGMLSQHNIFLRYRGIPDRPVMQNPLGPRSPEESNILTSLVKEDDGAFRAYVEDVTAGVTRKLSPNDSVANGKVIDFTMTGIVYQAPGAAPVTVPVGSNLTGAVSSVGGSRVGFAANRASDYTGFSGGQNNLPIGRGNNGNFGGGLGNNNGGGRRGGFTPTPAVVVPPTALPGSEGMSLEERMRLRRAAETLPGAAVPQSALPAAAAPAPLPEAAPAPAPIIDPAVGGNLSIEEQMRVRRLQGR